MTNTTTEDPGAATLAPVERDEVLRVLDEAAPYVQAFPGYAARVTEECVFSLAARLRAPVASKSDMPPSMLTTDAILAGRIVLSSKQLETIGCCSYFREGKNFCLNCPLTDGVREAAATAADAAIHATQEYLRLCNAPTPTDTVPVSREWHSMDSAPKDGTWVLLWWPHWHHAPITGYYDQGWVADRAISEGVDPLAWQPLHIPTAAEIDRLLAEGARG